MHGPLEARMAEKPALQPKAAIGPAVRAVAAGILAQARQAISDPDRTNEAAVHQFRRAMKEWRALMRLLAPFIPDATRWRHEGRNHARSLAHARDGAAALNAFDTLIDKGNLVLSARTSDTIRARLEALRGSEERQGLTPMLRDAIIAWLDVAAAAIEMWPLDPFDFSSIASELAEKLSQRAPPRPGRLDGVEPRRPAHIAPARRRTALSDGIDQAALAALRPHVDRRSRAHARTARPMSGHRSARCGSPNRIRCWRIGARA